jgi:Ran GTPase-activating protein (RanGAP) involved in mRNA processing and transport
MNFSELLISIIKCCRLEILQLHENSYVDDLLLRNVAFKCKQLWALNLIDCPRVTVNGLIEFLKMATQLKVLDLLFTSFNRRTKINSSPHS